jgi:hypothetical protein
MKYSIYGVITMILICACQPRSISDTKQESVNTTSIAVPFAGQWLSEDYYQSIRSDRSPRKAQEDTDAVFIEIPDSTDQKTSMIYRFHEAGPELVVRRVDSLFQIWEMQGDTLHRMAFSVEVQNDGGLKIGDQRFKRIEAQEKDNFFQILEEILFKGNYVLPDGKIMEWKANGEISGWDAYSHYHVLLDYMDAGLQVDQVGLGKTADSLTYFAFKMNDERLELYHLKCREYSEEEKRCLDVDFGKQAWVFHRK